MVWSIVRGADGPHRGKDHSRVRSIVMSKRSSGPHRGKDNTGLCTLHILPYLLRNSTQNTEIRIC